MLDRYGSRSAALAGADAGAGAGQDRLYVDHWLDVDRRLATTRRLAGSPTRRLAA